MGCGFCSHPGDAAGSRGKSPMRCVCLGYLEAGGGLGWEGRRVPGEHLRPRRVGLARGRGGGVCGSEWGSFPHHLGVLSSSFPTLCPAQVQSWPQGPGRSLAWQLLRQLQAGSCPRGQGETTFLVEGSPRGRGPAPAAPSACGRGEALVCGRSHPSSSVCSLVCVSFGQNSCHVCSFVFHGWALAVPEEHRV